MSRIDKIESLCKTASEKERCLELLPSVRKALAGSGQIYCSIDTVARSGMSRTIKVLIIHRGEVINLNRTPFAKIYGDSCKNGTVRINGCGMDMLFEATYRLYRFLFNQKRKPYQQNLNQYQTI